MSNRLNVTLPQIKNYAFNLLGQIVPMLVGLVTIPMFISGLGQERFSLLTLAWAALAYFSLFDLGFGRATTKLTAEMLATSDEKEIPPLYWTSMLCLLLMSMVGTGILVAFTPWLLSLMKELSPPIMEEARLSISALAIALPFMALTANARGIMEARGRFIGINILQVVVGLASYLVPIFLLETQRPLLNVILSLVAIRILNMVAHLALNFFSMPELLHTIRFDREYVARLWRFGGWLTVSNVIGPILFYFDRFFLGMLVPVKAVAFYTTPLELVLKLWIIPHSLVRVLFPEFAVSLQTDPLQTKRLYKRAVVTLAAAMTIPCAILFFAAKPLLSLWLGQEFAAGSAACTQILAVGVWINAIAWVPFTLLQTLDKTKLTALLHTVEVPFYAIVFWISVSHWGLEGAAIAWSVRVLVDTICMFFFANRYLRERLSH